MVRCTSAGPCHRFCMGECPELNNSTAQFCAYGCWKMPLKMTDFRLQDSSGKANGGYYFPISSTSDLDIEEDMIGPHSAKCVRMNWSDDVVTVNYFYSLHGSGNAYFHCEQVHPPKNMWKCKHLRADDGTTGKNDRLQFL